MMFLSFFRAHSSKCFRFSKFNQSYLNYSQTISNFWKGESLKKIIDKENFKLVYEFRYVVSAAFILRLKYIFPPLSLVAISTTFAFDSSGKTALTSFALCFIQWIIILVFSRNFQNLIGKVYVNKEGNVKDIVISSLSKKGLRVNNIHLLKDMTAVLFKSKIHKKVGLASVYFKNSASDYKLFVNPDSYKMHDANILKALFGSDELFNFTKSKKKENKVSN